jgi:arylformamidase
VSLCLCGEKKNVKYETASFFIHITLIISFNHHERSFRADLSKPIDLSIPLRDGAENPNCFWAPMPEFSPVRAGDFVGSTQEGGVVNFFNVRLNPHGNGTHTECVGHIARERFVLRECLIESHFFAKIVSLYPRKTAEGDRVIFQDQLEEVFAENEADALIIRTLPNEELKLRQNYSGANSPYMHHEALEYLVKCGVKHLLLDLPSVDREEDGGQLLAHRAFWQYPQATRVHATITEMVFVPNEVRDGYYLLNLQTSSLDLDASPSKPVVFELV